MPTYVQSGKQQEPPAFVAEPPPGGLFIGGGVLHNNPSEHALAEARRIWTNLETFCLVSIGTGCQRTIDFVDMDSYRGNETNLFLRLWSSAIEYAPYLRYFELTRIFRGVGELRRIAELCVSLTNDAESTHNRLLLSSSSSNPDLRFPYYRFNVTRGLDVVGFHEWRKTIRLGQLTSQYMLEAETLIKREDCVKQLFSPPVAKGKAPLVLTHELY
jgi:hypothetical protein